MYLLDTNVVSELRRSRPHGAILNWIQSVPEEQLFVSAVTMQAFSPVQADFSTGVRLGVGMAAFHLTSTSYHYLTKSPMKKNIYRSFVKQW